MSVLNPQKPRHFEVSCLFSDKTMPKKSRLETPFCPVRSSPLHGLDAEARQADNASEYFKYKVEFCYKYLYIYNIVYRYVIHNMSLLQYTYILKSTRHTLKTKILKKLSESTPQGSSIFERGGPGPGICSRYRLAVGQVKSGRCSGSAALTMLDE
jgi:hypothetical protein